MSKIQKRKGHKYSEVAGGDVDDKTVKKVLGRSPQQQHAFDGIEEAELTEAQV